MEKIIGALSIALLLVAFAIFIGALLAFPVMVLWNWVGVDVLGLKEIGLGQAWGLMVLSSLLFKSSASTSK